MDMENEIYFRELCKLDYVISSLKVNIALFEDFLISYCKLVEDNINKFKLKYN